MVTTHEWLDQVKPGYSEKFGAAFDEIGIEDTDDLLNLDDDLYAQLLHELEACGARSMHQFNIQRALTEFLVDNDAAWLPPDMAEGGTGSFSSSSLAASSMAAAAASHAVVGNSSSADARLFDKLPAGSAASGKASATAVVGSSSISSSSGGGGASSSSSGGGASSSGISSSARLIDQLPDVFGIVSNLSGDGAKSAARDFPPQLQPYARAVAEYVADHFPTWRALSTAKPAEFDRVFSQADRGVLRETAVQAGRTLPQVRRTVDLLMPFDERRRAAFATLRKLREGDGVGVGGGGGAGSSAAAGGGGSAPSSSAAAAAPTSPPSPSKPAWNPHHTRTSATLPSHLGAFPPPVFPLQPTAANASPPARKPAAGPAPPPPKPTAAALGKAAQASASSVSSVAAEYGSVGGVAAASKGGGAWGGGAWGGGGSVGGVASASSSSAPPPAPPPAAPPPPVTRKAATPPPPKPLARTTSLKSKSSPKHSPKPGGKSASPKSVKRPASARAAAKRAPPGPGSPPPPALGRSPSYSERQRKAADAAFARGTLTSVNCLPSPPKPNKRTAAFASDTIRGDAGVIPRLNSAPPPAVATVAAPAVAAAAAAAAAAEDPAVPNMGTSHFLSLGGRFNFMSIVKEQQQQQQQTAPPDQAPASPVGASDGRASPPDGHYTAGRGASSPIPGSEAAALRKALLVSDLVALEPAPGTPPFAFGSPPPDWLVSAAADGCRDLSDVARITSLEHQGPIDALEQSGEILAEYNRWLLMASKRVLYLQQKEVEARRSKAVQYDKEAYAQRGKALQQQAWEQRGQAAEAERRLVERKQAEALVVRQQALARKADQQHREQLYSHYSKFVHDEIQTSHAHVEEAKAAVAEHNAAVGSTIRAVKGALEQKKSEIQAAKEAEARAARDRVKASSMVMVPPEVAAQIARREGKRPKP